MIFSVFQKLYMVVARSAVGMRVCVFFLPWDLACAVPVFHAKQLHSKDYLYKDT